ncbi:cation/H(+) antiporter 15-like [Panicum virgatum]|uniref:cation/H(+) antiporter 15-like n=1 Tax=Panicum virgatum TaxID=38727 RepID=UPI0019D68EE7|nr:cation/H(+) antiporter 15-like [Panicum virgatum]
MFLGDQPLRFALPLFLVQVSLILLLSAAAHLLVRRLAQSRFVTHMLVGILLGPTFLGRCDAFRAVLFSERGTYILESVSLVALILFLFSMGVKTDLGLLRRPSGRALAVALTGALVPLAVTLPVFHALRPSLPDDLRGTSLVSELAVRLSLSSFPVIADALSDLDLLNTDLGRIALTAFLITDVVSWFIRACSAAFILVTEATSPAFTAKILASFVGFVLFVGLRLDSFFIALFLPVYMALSGYRTDPGELRLGATAEHYSVLTLSMVLITAVSTPLISLLYDPAGQFARAKRRTLEEQQDGGDLRVLACLYTEDHAAPLIDLLDASGSSREAPVSLVVLHLTELVGRAVSVLKPHRHRKATSNPSPSDRIVNAFRYFEQQAAAVTVSPYVAQAPYSSMHHDVCSLAHGRKATLVLLPFHKSSDGARSTANAAVRAANRAVLQYAPCSVAILVDHGLAAGSACATAAGSLLQRVALYFLGGADDREALAYASRMAEAGAVSLTVVRFKLRNWVGMGGRDEARDEEVLQDFWTRHRDNDRAVYVEKTVEDGEGTASVVRSMSEKFDLLVVGRRGGDGPSSTEGSSAALTSGLSEWSEFPELGVLGDMLASAEFASKVSILVIQQQPPNTNNAVAPA